MDIEEKVDWLQSVINSGMLPEGYVVVSKQDLWRLYATGYCTDELRDICETIEQEQE